VRQEYALFLAILKVTPHMTQGIILSIVKVCLIPLKAVQLPTEQRLNLDLSLIFKLSQGGVVCCA